MIQETLDVIADAITAQLPTMLAAMPGSGAATLQAGGAVVVTRTLLDEQAYNATPIGVRVEQQDAVSVTWPFEAQDETTEVAVSVTCWLNKLAVSGLQSATDDQMIRAVRALARATDAAIRTTLGPAAVVHRDGVQVRCPSRVAFGEPELGDDAALTVMTLSLSVPAIDYWALSAGSV